MGNKSLFPVVAVPRAFFGTFFRLERKYYPLRGGSPTVRAVVGASFPHWRKGDCACGRTKGLFSPPLWNTRVSKVGEKPIRRQVPIRADAAHQAPRRFFRQSWLTPLLAGGFPLAPAPLRAVPARSSSIETKDRRLRAHQRAFLSPLWKPSDTEAAEKPIGGKIPIRAAAGPSSHRQPKTARQENPLSRRAATIFPKINPLLHPPLRRTQCASDTPDRKSRWAGLPASAWPSSRPYPPSRSRLSGTARQWGWSCTS